MHTPDDFRGRGRPVGSPLRGLVGALVLLVLVPPAGAEAQLGAVEAFARRVSDLSFYVSGGTLAGASSELDKGFFDVSSFGVELLFEVAEIARPIPGAARPQRPDSVRRIWTGMEIVRSGDRVDTIYRYEIEPVPPPPPPSETVWTLEMGIGYGQLQGFELEDPALDLSVAVRDLPAVSLYITYEPWGNYFGLRTGFMKTRALQVVDGEGSVYSGEADAFLFGGLAGYAFAADALWLFVETSYLVRAFPSVEWRGAGPLPSGIPRELDVSGWSLGVGIQFPFN